MMRLELPRPGVSAKAEWVEFVWITNATHRSQGFLPGVDERVFLAMAVPFSDVVHERHPVW